MNKLMKPPPGETAAAFLKTVNPAGPWAVASIHPDTNKIRSAYFTDIDRVRDWAGKLDGHENCYYIAHPTKQPSGKGNRTNKSDAVEFRHHHADYDLDKLDAGHEWFDLTLDERKRCCEDALRALDAPGPPTLMVDTGGGIQALWRLDDPEPNTPQGREQIEGFNRTLVGVVPGGDDCWDCMHLLRLPGPMNLPNAKKRARGRTASRPRLIEDSGPTYRSSDFALSLEWTPPRVPKVDVDVDIGAPEFTGSEEALAALVIDHDLAPWAVEIIRDGTSAASTGKDTSHSAQMFRAVRHMVRQGVPDEVILGLLLDGQWGISTHILESRHSDAQQVVYAQKQIRAAQGANLAEDRKREQEAQDDFRDPPGDEWTRDGNEVVAEEAQRRFEQHVGLIGQRDPNAIPKTPWLVEGLLLRRDITLLGGMGGTGKSLLIWQICVSVSTATPFAGWEPNRPRKVLVLSGEDDFDEIERRVVAACKAMGVERSMLGDNFMVLKDRRIRMATKGKDGAIKAGELWDLVRWAVQHEGIELLVIDPLMKVSAGLDESSSDDQDTLFEKLRALTEGTDCAILIADHFNKSGVGGNQGSLRGSSAKVDASRITMTLSRMTTEEHDKMKPPRNREVYVHLEDPKQNYAKAGGRWAMVSSAPR